MTHCTALDITSLMLVSFLVLRWHTVLHCMSQDLDCYFFFWHSNVTLFYIVSHAPIVTFSSGVEMTHCSTLYVTSLMFLSLLILGWHTILHYVSWVQCLFYPVSVLSCVNCVTDTVLLKLPLPPPCCLLTSTPTLPNVLLILSCPSFFFSLFFSFS